MNPLETYLKELRDIRSTGAGVAETSFYPALSNLFNEIGKTLKPTVRCVINIANRGAGLPDGGFFTSDQFQKAADSQPRQGQLPQRGALEAKAPSDDVQRIIGTDQIKRYCTRYGIVAVTNYHEFVLVGRDPHGNPSPLEQFSLAEDEAAFWEAAAHPQSTAKQQGDRFGEFIQRVLLANAPLSEPQDLAWFLASYARDAKSRVEAHKDLSALASVREALENALGMRFTGDRGEHFFRSTLVQTLFYGVFSAWVLWHRERPNRTDLFDWRVAEWFLNVPFIRTLYHQVASPDRLGPLGLVEVLDWTAGALNRVERASFFEKFHDEHAVQYFYEPFLEAFDPELRKELGVWFTPPEIVQYQVARVDTVLREELGLADGLADPKVIVLDPCCGTGAYLVEVLRRIADTLRAKGGDALLASDLKRAAMTRIFGFELLPAPFVVSHLQLGLLLHRLGAPLSAEASERVGVYLTNSLTGWEPPRHPQNLLFPELAAEREAAEKVKRESMILVVLGNPPYNAYAGVSPEEERGLVEPYKVGLNTPIAQGGWGIRKFNLDDLYIRFFRLAERRIAEMSGKGIVSFVSNFSYLSKPSFVVMRKRFLSEFDRLWIDCMNGDSRETGKLTPDGKPDPSTFSTEYNREGIRVGTAVCVIVRKERRRKSPVILFRQFWGIAKREDLLASLKAKSFGGDYIAAEPCNGNRFSFRPERVSDQYNAWPKVVDLCGLAPSNGLLEKRGGALIDIDRDRLDQRMRDYFDPSLSWDDYRARHVALTQEQAGFVPSIARKKALASENYDTSHIVRYAARPFDSRWCYYTQVCPIWNRARPDLWEQFSRGNEFLVTRPAGVASPEGVPFYYTRLLGDNDFQRGHAYYLPLQVVLAGSNARNHGTIFEPSPNLSAAARSYLSSLGIENPDASSDTAGLIWMHALAVGYSPKYLAENADGIRGDWPQIPLPDKRTSLQTSAGLGRRVAALLDTEADVPGVTEGDLEPVFRTIAAIAKEGGGALDPDAGDLALAVGWGYGGKDGVTMPGKGRIIQRPYGKTELDAIAEAAASRGLSRKQAIALLGADTRDVYLNDKAYWMNVPANVWEFYIGGYQVIKKWLSYREQKLLGRALRAEEAREVSGMARRLSAIILLQPAMDANYRHAKDHAYSWPQTE